MLLCIKTLHCSSRPVLPLPGRILFTTAMKAVPSLQLGPKSLTCFDHWLIMFAQKIFSLNKKYFVIIFPPLLTSTPSWRETWAWTHCSSAFLAPSFHFSCALRTLPSRTEQYRFNSANIFRKSRYFLTWAGVCVSVLAAGVSAALHAGAGEPLAQLLQDSGVLLNLDKRGVLVKTRLYLV